jgi:amino acid transporter
MDRRAKQSLASASAGMLGGAAFVVAAIFVKWFDLDAQGELLEYFGYEFYVASGIAAIAALGFIFAFLVLLRARKKGGRVWAICALVCASFPLLLSIATAARPEEQFASFAAFNAAEDLGVSEAEWEAALADDFASGRYQATAGPGVYLSLLGSVLAVIGAIIAIAWAKRFKKILSLAGRPDRDAHEAPPMPLPPD